MDVLIPPDIPIAEIEWRILDNTAVSTSPLNGVTTTFTRPGTRWGARLSFRDLKDRDRARLLAILASVRGRSGRVYFTSAADPARTGGYSFPELFANADFSNGTTGWSGSSGATSGVALSVRDRIMRSTRTGNGANSFALQQSVNPTVTAYLPYAARFFLGAARGAYPSGWSIYDNVSGARATAVATQRGLFSGAIIPGGTSSAPSLLDESVTGTLTGDYVEVPFASFTRCALIDNGLNALKYSDDPTNAAWTKTRCTASAVAGTAPDGASDAMAIIEDSSASTSHYMTQSSTRTSVAEDLCAYGYFKRRTGTRNVRVVVLSGGSDYGYCYFDLNAGTAGTPTVAGSATNARAFIRNVGNGWYFCAVVARCPASTALNAEFDLASGGSNSYTGDGSSSIYAWGLGAARSGVPTRGATTVATAAASGTSQTGGGLYLKGLPASTQNIRAAGDMVEIILPTGSQLVRLTAALDSDAAGLGYLQFENPVRVSPADNAAVIFNQPMMRGILTEGPAWPTRPGLFSDFDIDLIEDIAP